MNDKKTGLVTGCHAGLGHLHNAIREVESMLLSAPDMSEEDIAEGYLYIMGLWKWAVERVFTGFDVDRPHFTRYLDSFARRAHENPDNRYLSADIDGSSIYRITGNRGSHADLVFEVVAGLAGDNKSAGQSIDTIDASRIQSSADGHYEIIVGGPQRGPNYLHSRPDATAVFVRQSFNNWQTESLDAPVIERIGPADGEKPYTRADAKHVEHLFAETAKLIVDHAAFLQEVGAQCRDAHPLNGLTQPSVKIGGGVLPGQFSSHGRYKLGDEEALLMALTPATCPYQGVTLCHHHWFASFDYRNTQCSLSLAQSHLSSDGIYRFVISATDPGVTNWLDTSGHDQGFIMFRWQNVTGLAPKVLDVKVVSVSRIFAEFPDDEPQVDRVARLWNLRSRRLSVDRRFI